MRSKVNLVAFLLTLSCVVRLLECSRSVEKHRVSSVGHKGYPVVKKVVKVAHKIAPQSTVLVRGEDKTKVVKTVMRNNGLAVSKDYLQKPVRGRRRKRKMQRTMMALLMAYKMKFIALVPTLLGGLILLKGTALLAGFFFALFAAVLGLKVH